MELFDRFEVVDAAPALYDERLDALIVADMHIGVELSQAGAGMLVPRFQTEELLDELENLQERFDASRLIVDGDVKHSFGRHSTREDEELNTFLNSISYLFDEVVLVKGNHDSGLGYRTEEYTNITLSLSFMEEDVLFVHGDEIVEEAEEQEGVEYVVIGHEHPALSLQDDVGLTEKVSCFLYGDMSDGRKMIVLPAFSRLASGTAVNEVPVSQLLSPYLRREDIGSFRAVAVDREAGLFTFPAIEKL